MRATIILLALKAKPKRSRMDNKKLVPHEVMIQAEKTLKESEKIIDEYKIKYWVEYWCQEKTDRLIKDRTNPAFYCIGKYVTKQEAKEAYQQKYEDIIRKKCKGKYPDYTFIAILNDKEKEERTKQP